MTDDKIAEIRKRHEDVAWRYYELPLIYEDRAVLLAEVERLREALRDIERGDYSDPMCVRTPEQRAREALEGKP